MVIRYFFSIIVIIARFLEKRNARELAFRDRKSPLLTAGLGAEETALVAIPFFFLLLLGELDDAKSQGSNDGATDSPKDRFFQLALIGDNIDDEAADDSGGGNY